VNRSSYAAATSWPSRSSAAAVAYCLGEAGIGVDELDAVGFYDKPLLTFERILETYLGVIPRVFRSFLMAGPLWIKEKLFMDRQLREALGYESDILYSEHHGSHAASAFFPSPFEEAEAGEFVLYRTDARGLNNPQGTWEFEAVDVGVLGDSYAEGYCVPPEQSFAGLIRDRLPRTLNLGLAGTGPLAQLAMFRERLVPLRPPLVLWFYFGPAGTAGALGKPEMVALCLYDADAASYHLVTVAASAVPRTPGCGRRRPGNERAGQECLRPGE
jgi:hypothetical protein